MAVSSNEATVKNAVFTHSVLNLARPVATVQSCRVSRRALLVFEKIADAWGLNDRQRYLMLGQASARSYEQWKKLLARDDIFSMTIGTLLRIESILRIYRTCNDLFESGEDAASWLKGDLPGSRIAGVSALTWMTYGAQDGIILVAEHLRRLERAQGGDAVPPAGPIPGKLQQT